MGQKWVETHFSPTLNPFRDCRENPLLQVYGHWNTRNTPEELQGSVAKGVGARGMLMAHPEKSCRGMSHVHEGVESAASVGHPQGILLGPYQTLAARPRDGHPNEQRGGTNKTRQRRANGVRDNRNDKKSKKGQR